MDEGAIFISKSIYFLSTLSPGRFSLAWRRGGKGPGIGRPIRDFVWLIDLDNLWKNWVPVGPLIEGGV